MAGWGCAPSQPGAARLPPTLQAGPAATFERRRLSSRSCAAVNAEPQVPHRQLVKELLIKLGPSLAE